MSEQKNIDVTPTKRFFVDMFIRDIPLEQAILDLVDNCVDGARSIMADSLEGYWIKISFDEKEFRIVDNCGGFSRAVAQEYAFRFGREEGHDPGKNSIGQFGVGMKRALFKFGSAFIVRSATKDDEWAIDIDVEKWVKTKEWEFPWSAFTSKEISKQITGTEIIVSKLRPEVSAKFSTENFTNTIIRSIKSKHRQFVANGLSINVNDQHVEATSLDLLQKDSLLRPGVDNLVFKDKGEADVKVRIIVAVGDSSPREAGWYVIGNGRVILEADTRRETGWGAEGSSGSLLLPKYHNQYARFRGIVSFESSDSSRIPWNTTKDDVDEESAIWQSTFRRMTEMARPVMAFLNDLDKDIDEHGHKHSALLDVVNKSAKQKIETYTRKVSFSAPSKEYSNTHPKTIKIQYFRPTKDVEFLKEELGASSASELGGMTFDYLLKKKKSS